MKAERIFIPKTKENKVNWKSVGISEEVYDRLKLMAEVEDRAINRQLARIINQAFDERNFPD